MEFCWRLGYKVGQIYPVKGEVAANSELKSHHRFLPILVLLQTNLFYHSLPGSSALGFGAFWVAISEPTIKTIPYNTRAALHIQISERRTNKRDLTYDVV